MNKFSCSFIFAILALYLNSCTLDEAVCEKDGHLYGDICEPESVEHCGSHDKNCYSLPGIKDALCENQLCIILSCKENYHIASNKSELQNQPTDIICEPDTVDNCGQSNIKCGYTNGEKDAEFNYTKYSCSEAKCMITGCKEDYHLEDGKCVYDNTKSCSGINCETTKGWKAGTCREINASTRLQCIAEKCHAGYHTYNLMNEDGYTIPCERDNAQSCGGEVCTVNESQGEKTPICKIVKPSTNPEDDYPECAIGECITGYHLNEKQTACEKDNIYHCGAYNNDCTIRNGWMRGECIDGQCVATECNRLMYHLSEDDSVARCVPNTNESCGKDNKKCDSDEYCMIEFCTSSCFLSNFQACEGLGCVDFGSVIACGGCQSSCEIEHATSTQCNYNSNKNCVSDGSCCKLRACETGYHIEGNQCIADTEACSPDKATCTSYPNTSPTCVEGLCNFECKTGYGNCNNLLIDGCETKLDDYGLSDCNTCSSEYTACGNYSINESITVPLCLKQGFYYKNYNGSPKSLVPCNSEIYKYHKQYGIDGIHFSDCLYDKNENKYINYDYTGRDNYVYQSQFESHWYQLIAEYWRSPIYAWSSEHCALACTQNRNITTLTNGKHTDANGDTIEAWSHQCAPKQTCNQFDTFTFSLMYTNHDHFYVDYGCSD